MNVKEKQKNFKQDLSSLTKMLEKNVDVDQTDISNHIMLIKADLMSQDESIKKAALDMLDFLLNEKSNEIQNQIVKLLDDDNENDIFDLLVVKYMKKRFMDNIMKDQNFTDIILPWQYVNSKKLSSVLEDVFSNELPREKCKYFFINRVIPAMMLLDTENTLRDLYIETAFLLSRIVPISELTTEELEKFLKEINIKYIGAISQLRDSGFLNWHKLWIFLVRFCDRNIHNSMDLTNRLLRVVEFAFRNSSVEQRLKGYDCWKELIDNASLDKNHISNSKQIKLLITPLRAKFSKQEVVICKRFDVFVYLLEKLQQKAILCLQDFLEFCFGSVGDSKGGQGRSIPQLWTKSTKVLVEIIGHSHGSSIDCLNTKEIINLEKPIINHRNIQSCYRIVINSVSESCILLKDVEKESKRMEVIKCMWVTVFDLVVTASQSNRDKYLQVLSDVLDNFIHQSTSNPYFQELVVLIFTVLMSFDKELICECIESILSQLLTILFTTNNIPVNISENFKQALMHSFSKVLQEEDKLKMMNIIMNSFANLKSHEDNILNMTKVWLILASELISDLKVEKIEEFIKLNEFFLWPALNMQQMEENSKKLTTVNWLKIYKKLCQESETKKMQVLKDLEKIFKNNPLLSSNIICLLNILSQFETKFSQGFVNKLMSVSSMILALPNLKSEDGHKLSTLVMQYFEPALECYKTENDDVIKNSCISIDYILKIHEGFRILEPLTNFLKQSPKEMRTKYSKYLENLLLELYNKESDSKSYKAKELAKLLAVLHEKEDTDKKTFVIPTGRSARIANLAKNSPKSPKKGTKSRASPTTLRLFGKDLDSLSPLKVKGSQLNDTPTPKKNKITKTGTTKSSTIRSVNDELSSEFVQINTEIKFKPEKLCDHQREVMHKRREDIPALYQDLSQSLSQDIFSSKSNSKEATEAAPKVIIELIEPILESTEKSHWNFFTEERNRTIKHVEEPSKPSNKLTNNTQYSDQDMFSNTSDDRIPAFENDISKKETRELVESNTKIIEQKMSSDLFSDESPLSSSDNKKREIVGINKKTEESAEEKKKRKMEYELMKLKMDIVGAAEFVGTARRTRPKEKLKKSEETLTSKTSPKSEKGRKSLSLERNDSKVAVKRRKSSGTVLVGSDLSSAFSVSESSPERPIQHQKHEKTDESVQDSLDQLKNNPHVEIISGLNENYKSKTPAFNKKNRKTTKAFQKSPTGSKNTNNSSKLFVESTAGEDKGSKDELTQENVAQVDVTTNSRRKSLKASQADINPPSGKKKTVRKTKNTIESSVSDNEISKINENIQEINGSIQTNHEFSQFTPKRGQKRKYSIDDDDDENIIQSSQESAVELTPLLNSSKKKLTKMNFGQNNSNEESTMVQQKTLVATDISIGKEVNTEALVVENRVTTDIPVVGIKETDVVQNVEVAENVETQTEDLLKEYVVTVETQDLVKVIEEEETEEVVKMYEDSEDATSLPQDIELALKQVANFEKEIEESVSKSEETKGESAIGKMTVVDDVNELMAEAPLGVNTTQDSTLTHETTQDSSAIQDSTQEDIPSEISDKKHIDTQDTEIIPSNTQDTPENNSTCFSEDMRPDIPYFDLPKKPQLTDSEQIMCRMDTLSICLPNDPKMLEEALENRQSHEEEKELKIALDSNEAESIQDILATSSTGRPPLSTPPNTPDQKSSSLPSSPITLYTPTRTNELLDNTIDISPITSKSSSPNSEVSVEIPKSIAIFFREEDEEHEEKYEEKDIETNLEDGSSFCDEYEERQNVIEETEQAHLEEAPISENASEKETDPTALFNSAQLPPKDTQECPSKLPHAMGVVSPMPTKLFLKRRGGGVACSPSTGRIKRLMSHFGPKKPASGAEEIDEDDILRFTRDIPSPLAVPRSGILKRKLSEVSDGDGLSPCAKRKRVNFSDPCLTSKKIFLKDDYQPTTLEAKRLFDPIPDSRPNQDSLKHIFNFSEEATNSESECPETELSLEIVNPMILRKDRPIYPKLADCKDDVLVILKRVTSPIFITSLTNKLKTKNIRTIGDLAQQTESEINRIPFKVPVVANVYKALDSYYKMKNGITGTEVDTAPKVNGNKEVEKLKLEVEKVDVATEMRSLVEKAAKESNTLDDLARVLLSSMEKKKIVDLIKKLDSPITVEDFLEETNHNQVLKRILDQKDPTEVLVNVHQNMNEIQRENLPWEILLRDRPVSDLKRGIAGVIEQNMFSRSEIIENCLLPLIQNPSEISTYLKSLSVLDFGDVVAERLENENAVEFFCRIMKNNPDFTVEMLMRMLCDNQVFSPKNLLSSFQECLGAESDESQKEMMVEMFRFVSEKLDVSTLGSLHVEFINKLINKDK